MRSFKPSPSMVVAVLALVFAMAGTGLAAKSYLITSSKQIKDGVITGADVQNASLTGSDVKMGSLTGNNVRDGSLSAADFGGTLPSGVQGPKGDSGPAGPSGPAGKQGDTGPSGTSRIFSDYDASYLCPCDSIEQIIGFPAVMLAGGLVWANAVVHNDTDSSLNLQCSMTVDFPGPLLDDARVTVPERGYATLSMQAAVPRMDGILGVRCKPADDDSYNPSLGPGISFSDLDSGVIYADTVQ